VLQAILLISFGACIGIAYLVFTHRRGTPFLNLELDRLPALEDGLATLAGLTGGAVSKSNAFRVYQNGDVYDAMESDIGAAERTIHLETFVWTAGSLERRFVELFSRKATEGVDVRLLIDAMGGWDADSKQLEAMCRAGVQLSVYCKPRWWNLRRFNHRTHRKLLIVDGHIGYTFGHGIADQWLGSAQDKDHWRDTAVRAEGPVVQALQSVFMENWIEETHCVPSGESCFPVIEAQGDTQAHVVSSASDEAMSKVALLYTVAIASARREVIIQNPYFVPDNGVCQLLAKMVERGVAVHLMVPGANTDSPFVRRAGCYLYRPLLQAGVRVYEFQPTLSHQKIVIVDGIWSHIGSTNFDSRSLALNEEVGIGILDEKIAAELRRAFEADLQRSREVTLAEWRKRPAYSHALDWLFYQVHDQL